MASAVDAPGLFALDASPSTTPPTTPRPRQWKPPTKLPRSLLMEELGQVQTHARFNTELWMGLVRKSSFHSIQQARIVFENLLTVFPSSAFFWRLYIALEGKQKQSNSQEVIESLFRRCLKRTLNPGLWNMYLSYVRSWKQGLPTFNEKMAQAYDFALEQVGMDYHSLSLWRAYIWFLKRVEATGAFAETQKTTAIRRVFQTAMSTPLLNEDLLWKDYVAFEQSKGLSVGASNAVEKRFLERSSNRVGSSVRTLYFLLGAINKDLPALPPLSDPEQDVQLQLWKQLIACEKTNPLSLPDHALYRRVMFAYKQCLVCFARFPEMHVSAAEYLINDVAEALKKKGETAASQVVIDEASQFLENSTADFRFPLLLFIRADLEEQRLQVERAKKIYLEFLSQSEATPGDVDTTLLHIQLMRFYRRNGNIKEARAIFKAGHEDPKSSFWLYVAAAIGEYHGNKNPDVAIKIFRLGLSRFGGNVEYIKRFVNFMASIGDVQQLHLVLREVTSPDAPLWDNSAADEIWATWLNFMAQFGSTAELEEARSAFLSRLRHRYESSWPHSGHLLHGGTRVSTHVQALIQKHRFRDLLPCDEGELMRLGFRKPSFSFAPYHRSLEPCPYEGGIYLPNVNAMESGPPHLSSPELPPWLPTPPPAPFMTPSLCRLYLQLPSNFWRPRVNVDELLEVFITLDPKRLELPSRGQKMTVQQDGEVTVSKKLGTRLVRTS